MDIFTYLCGKVTPGCLLLFFFNIILTLLLHYIHFSFHVQLGNENEFQRIKTFNYFPLIKKTH